MVLSRLQQGIDVVRRARNEGRQRAHEGMAREGKAPVTQRERLFIWVAVPALIVFAVLGFWQPLVIFASVSLVLILWELSSTYRQRGNSGIDGSTDGDPSESAVDGNGEPMSQAPDGSAR
jgi:hypothetical protein